MHAYVKYGLGGAALYLVYKAYKKSSDAALLIQADVPTRNVVGGKDKPTPTPSISPEEKARMYNNVPTTYINGDSAGSESWWSADGSK